MRPKIYTALVVTLYDFDDSSDSKDCYGDQFDHSAYILYIGCQLYAVTVNECNHHCKMDTIV